MRAAPLSVAVLVALAWACASPPPPADWDREMARALAGRAAERAAAGDSEAARRWATEAIQEARRAGSAPAEGRARLVLARLDRSLEQASAAQDLLEDDAELTEARLLEAELLLESGRPREALALLGPLIEAAAADEDLTRRGAREGLARHLAATAWRRLERPDEALREQRLALLALSLLADDQLTGLRRAATQARGDDLAARGDHAGAHEQHARAEDLARRLGDLDGQLAAQGARAADLAGMGRAAEAVALSARRARLALEGGRDPVARQAALQGLDRADRGDLPARAPVRRELLDLLIELDRRATSPDPAPADGAGPGHGLRG